MVTEHKIREFIDRLPKNKARVYLNPDLWAAMAAVLPEMKGHVNQRQILAHLIDELCKRGYSKPSNKKLVEANAVPYLPLWLKAPVGESLKNGENYVFQSEELAFLNNCKGRIRDLRWKQIDKWLLNGGRAAAWARTRERSLEIFNDEKALDKMRANNPFFDDGRIRLEDLRCAHAPVPIPFSIFAGCNSNRCIVIENSDTYATICQWNLTARHFKALAYGGGNAFSSSWEGLAKLRDEYGTGPFGYFGDIDEEGFNIPYRTAARMNEQGLQLSLAKDMYRLLMLSEPIRAEKRSALDAGAAKWIQNELGDELNEKVLSILGAGFRIPQERCTYDKLLSYFPSGRSCI